jgi:putative transposase
VGRETGIAVELQAFLSTAAGDSGANPRHDRRAEKRLASTQRRVSRRKKGSTRRKQAVVLLRRAPQQVQRHRAAFHHKTALLLLRHDATISLEELRVANLVRNHHLAKSIADAGSAACFVPFLQAQQSTLAVKS